jgi:glyoxylase-like metal-dependent hydrolase (beta-lactamase superfamily II)
MKAERLADGLWRWTGVHPQWEPEPDEGLPREVGCVYYEAEDAVVLIDPLVPTEAREHFLESLDRDVERARRPVAILLTCPWHARSAGELAERYGATVSVHGDDPRQPLAGARQYDFGDTLPGGVTSFDAHFHGEALLWIPPHGTLVAGDVLSVPESGLRVAPDEWLQPEERGGRMRESLGFLLELPVERVLVGHGEPVLANARAALERALHASGT